jgi:nitrogen regulatory protein P-II 1
MNMVLAFLPPHRLDRVASRLHRLPDFPGMTVSEARGHGREKLADEQSDELTDFTPTLRIEIVLPDHLVEPALQAIYEAAHSGARGDGKVYVLPVADALRIKTGERVAGAA